MIAGFMALHYGLDYLQYAIESIIDEIDVLHVAYSWKGSHGAVADVACPETERELKQVAYLVAGSKLEWHSDLYPHEGAQRDMIFEWAGNADLIVVVDSDEVYQSKLLKSAIPYALRNPQIKSWRVPMIHYWRSFKRAILHDYSYPVRLVNPHGEGEHEIPNTMGFINHFGYAITPTMMEYKWRIHGHRGELRDGWFDTVYLNKERKTDLHPCGNDAWHYEVINPARYLPEWMKHHKWYNTDWIES